MNGLFKARSLDLWLEEDYTLAEFFDNLNTSNAKGVGVMANDNWSPFYPTVIYPAQESTALQREMTSNLQAIVRDLSRIGQSQPQNQIVQVQSGDQDASYQIGASINDLRESLGRDLGGLRNELSGLSSQLEWSIGLLHDSIVEQTDVLLTIAKQQRIPTELKVSEYLTGAQEMVSQLASDIQSSRLGQNHIEQKFTAIDDRFLEAMEPKPRAGLMYAILLARAELYLLVKKDNEALAFLEESLIYAPQADSFDYSSYSYRLMGRIMFAQGNSLKAEDYLDKATDLSPRYAIAWYDRAQYLARIAPLTGAELAVSCLRHAIEMNEGFMLLASIEPNFDPIRKDVDALIETISQEKTDELRQSHLEAYDAQNAKIQRIRQIFVGVDVFEKKNVLANQLGYRFWQCRWGCENLYRAYYSVYYPGYNFHKSPNTCWSERSGKIRDKIQEITSIPERVVACANIDALRCLSDEVANLGKTCDKLLGQLESFEVMSRALQNASEHMAKGEFKIIR